VSERVDHLAGTFTRETVLERTEDLCAAIERTLPDLVNVVE
jgi:hypothetical protein